MQVHKLVASMRLHKLVAHTHYICLMQALVPEALAPLSLLNPAHGKALLCGDPK